MTNRQVRAPKPAQIAIGGGKGGSGGTLLSQALSVCAAQRGFSVALRGWREASNNSWIYRPRKIHGVDVHASGDSVELCEYDFVFTDIPSTVFTTNPLGRTPVQVDFGSQHILVVPVDLASEPSSAIRAHAFLSSLPQQLPWVAVQVCSQLDLKALLAGSAKVHRLAHYMARAAILHAQKPQLEADGQFCLESLQDQFQDLFDELCERLAMEAHPVKKRRSTARSKHAEL